MLNITQQEHYQVALENFPHKLQPIPFNLSNRHADKIRGIKHSAKYTFNADQLLLGKITAVGLVEMYQDKTDDNLKITAHFDVQQSQSGKTTHETIMPEEFILYGDYDLINQLWEFYFDWN